MTRRELRDRLEARMAPAERESWDNDGLLVAGDAEAPVRRVLLTLDITAGAVQAAIGGGYDAVLSHHPLLFSPLSAVTPEDPVSARVISLLGHGVAAFCYHTRLDAAAGGVNDALCERLGIRDAVPFGEGGIGRVGAVEPTRQEAFAAFVKQNLRCPVVFVSGTEGAVSRVAVVGGEGKDYVRAAKEAGADVFLSGNLGYHTMTDAAGIVLMEAGHYYTEAPVLDALRAWLLGWDPSLTADVFCSNVIRVY